MTPLAITMLLVAIVLVWGGLAVSAAHLLRHPDEALVAMPQRLNELTGPALVTFAEGWAVERVRSQAGDRTTYLRRPDLGRRLDADDARRLRDGAVAAGAAPGVCIVIGDGLSALAIEENAALRSSTLSVRSHGTSMSVRPKWPYAAVRA